jgi:hypothetical protein
MWSRIDAAAVLISLIAPFSMQSATAASFDNWTLGFNSIDNHFDSGPTVTTKHGSDAISVAFSNTVFPQALPFQIFPIPGVPVFVATFIIRWLCNLLLLALPCIS